MRRSIVARMLNRLAWTPQVLEAVVGWVASTMGTVEVEAVVAGAQLLSCVPRVLARIHSLLAVTLPTNHQLRCEDQCLHPPGIHPRVGGERAAPPPADHAHQRVAALLRDNEGTARVALARVLAGVSSADVHAECMWILDSRF